MSAPLAGKFQDHYEVLGLDCKSGSETIQLVYTKLAKKYNPLNRDTGDEERFEAVNLAYEVLSDPSLRREFDRVKGVGEEDGSPKFSGRQFFDLLGRQTGLRTALLCVLYDRRRSRPFTPSLSMRHIEQTIEATLEEFTFALWYLKQRNLAGSDDKSSLQITVEGIDLLENNPPSPEVVMPFIKPTAMAGSVAPAEKPPTAAPQNDSRTELRLGGRVVSLLKKTSAG